VDFAPGGEPLAPRLKHPWGVETVLAWSIAIECDIRPISPPRRCSAHFLRTAEPQDQSQRSSEGDGAGISAGAFSDRDGVRRDVDRGAMRSRWHRETGRARVFRSHCVGPVDRGPLTLRICTDSRSMMARRAKTPKTLQAAGRNGRAPFHFGGNPGTGVERGEGGTQPLSQAYAQLPPRATETAI
jgi:hypothetical protein